MDPKYSVALSSACPVLHHFVVDCLDTGVKCLEFLNSNTMPRCSFMLLDLFDRHLPRLKRRPETPEGAPRLVDLVKVEDERVLPAFYDALRDTLVAEDLEQAKRIAGGKEPFTYRVVTLDGDIIELDGDFFSVGHKIFP